MATEQKTPLELNDPLIELIAERFKVLSEPMRIRLLNELRDRDLTVGELCALTGASQQNVSKHLSILHQAAMVERSKEGNLMRYRIADPGVFELCEQVCGGVQRQIDALSAALRGSTA